MNTIKDLAKKMWDNLPFNSYNTEISKTHYCLRNYRHIDYQLLTDEEIENIFYNEVIVKWWSNLETWGNPSREYFMGLYFVDDTITPERIKEIYLKEHTKVQPKNEWISCEGYSAQEYPDFKKGWGVECYNGTKGMVEAYNTPYLYIEGQVDLIHKMNIKAYMTFEQPQSVDNTIEFNKWLEDKKQRYSENKEECYNDILSSTTSVIDQFLKSPYQAQKGVLESAVKCNEMFLEFVDNTIDMVEERERGITITNVLQPKAIEDNVWDEVEAEYINSIDYDMEHYNSSFLEHLKKNYSLIKK